MKKIIVLLALLAQIGIGQTLVERNVFYDNTSTEQSDNAIDATLQQETSEHQTLFSEHNSLGLYAALSNGIGVYNGNVGYVSGARLMLVANHYLSVGLGGKAFVASTESEPRSSVNSTMEYTFLSGMYGGIYLEPVIHSLKSIHLSTPILLGMGVLGRSEWDESIYDDEYFTVIGNNFLIVEPGIELEFNVTRWLRISTGAYYRFTTDETAYESDDFFPMNGVSCELCLKLGWF